MSLRSNGSARRRDPLQVQALGLDERIVAERVDVPFCQLPVALVTVIINSALLAYVLWNAVDQTRITLWLAAIWIVTAARLALLYAYKRRAPVSSARRWGFLFAVGAAANGLVWGASAVMIYPSGDTTLQVFLAFVLGGMTAGATASSSTFFLAFLAFAVPALTPMVVRAFDTGDRVHFVIGAMLTLFGLAMAQIARTGGRRLVESVRLRLKNEVLVGELQATTERLTELNRDLEARVAERTADLLDANRAKDEFLAVISHELRTPLTAVIGWAQLMKLGELSPSQREHAVETIERNAQAQAKLIEDLLDLSRITAGNPNVELVPMKPAGVIDAAIDAIRPAMNAKGIHFETHVDRTARTIHGDVARIQQIIGNLLSNAAKFTPNGGRVVLDMRYSERWLEISVSDTGEGMSAEFIPYAFDRFRQADSRSRRARSGLGLGLAISRQLAQLHGGTLEARSEGPGRGSTFKLCLPLESARVSPPATDSVGAAANRPSPSRALSGIDVLLVDDDPDTRDVVGAMLEQAGATATSVAGTEEAIAAVKRHRPTVIISDLDMPGTGGDGFALIRALRHLPHDDDGGQIPAIALTAHAGATTRHHALAAGFRSYMTKPVGPQQLVERIASVARGQGKPSTVTRSS